MKVVPSWYVCGFRSLTGIPCPCCGFTRSFAAITGGRILHALSVCPLAVALYACIVLLGLWCLMVWLSGGRIRPGPALLKFLQPSRKGALLLLGLVLLNWAYRIIT